MKRALINEFIRKNWKQLSDEQLARKCHISLSGVEHRRFRMGLRRTSLPADPKEAVEIESRKARDQKERKAQKQTLKILIAENERLQRELGAAIILRRPVKPRPIIKSNALGGEATMIALASDWHIEERVRQAEVNGLNEYTLEIAHRRAHHFFDTLLRLVQIEQQNTRVDHLVLGLLGDFITGDIHEELVETAQCEPAVAIRMAQEMLVAGIDHLLANSKLNLTCIAHSGNHGRTTKDQRHATEHGHSLEWLMYHALADRYGQHPRVHFTIPEAYHSYLSVYDKLVRFHHGHAINYGGGVGGITIPVRKAIAQWNTLKRADVDCFGHFHQAFDGGNFVCNGSMIGYNAYALSIKAGYEEPVQMLFGIHSKLGKYITRSIKFVYD
jgi:hypothetical protein